MQIESIVTFLLVGGIAGWLAGKLMHGGGFGLLNNIVVGIIGAFIGGYVFGAVGIEAGGIIGAIVISTVGAGILLFVVGLFKKD
ncbi:MAG: GlsB/YeaQ/YmgE family stress response membrane protein [Gammaproteobacteria bacterium]|nr:GlsB/YeaQ/YmgE family stress response membrane protein [Gammaproteobacteria bacterium]